MGVSSQKLVRMLDELGRVTDEPGRLTRTFLSPAMRRAHALVAGWMKEAGLAVRVDPVGNLIGRREADPAPAGRDSAPAAPTLLLGSHLDTVRDAGKFDGALGVVLSIAALAELRRRGVRLPFAVEVLGFSDEEGVRFPSAYLGSRGYCGKLTVGDLKLCDTDGASVWEAISGWNGLTSRRSTKRVGGNALHLPGPAHRPRDLLGYVEIHLEQGPVLEARKLAVGVVSAIAGQSRFQLTWTGRAGHAGTTPMALRRDALAGAAEFIVGVEAIARRTPGLVATVGALKVSSGAANVIPGSVTHALDIRHARDAVRRAALRQLGRLATRIARRRRLVRRWRRTLDNGAVRCSPGLTARLARSARRVQGESPVLVSGAGHDGVILSTLAPVAMLFVRCRGGLSHHPGEFVSGKDLNVALQVTIDFLQRLAATHANRKG